MKCEPLESFDKNCLECSIMDRIANENFQRMKISRDRNFRKFKVKLNLIKKIMNA